MLEIAVSPPESTYIVAALFGIIYAVILSTKPGMRFSRGQSTAWIATAIGILITWLAAYVTGGEFTLLLFVFSGTPLAIRSAVLSEISHKTSVEQAFEDAS